MKIDLRQILAGLVALAVAVPAVALPSNSPPEHSRSVATKSPAEVVAIVTAAQGAAVRDALAPAGTTVYSGDTLRTYSSGAVVSVGHSSATFAPESRARFSRSRGRSLIELERGGMTLRSSSASPVEARLADATVTGTDSAILSIAVLSEKRAIVAAERGDVTLRTPRDGKSVSLRAGESVEVTLATVAEPQGSSGGSTASTMSRGRTAILIGVIIGGISLAAWALRPDNDLARNPKQDLISPYRLP